MLLAGEEIRANLTSARIVSSQAHRAAICRKGSIGSTRKFPEIRPRRGETLPPPILIGSEALENGVQVLR